MKQAARSAAFFAVAVAVLFVGLVLLGVRFSVEAEHALRLSDREFDQGHLRESLLFARRAGYLTTPRVRHVDRAMARLDAISVGAEASSRREIAILAWQSIRSMQTLVLVEGHLAERLDWANQRLAVLLADDGRRSSMIETEQLSRRLFRILDRQCVGSGPPAAVFLLVLVGAATVYLALGRERRTLLAFCAGGGLAGLGSIGWAILLSSR